jgi:hypothetical protein
MVVAVLDQGHHFKGFMVPPLYTRIDGHKCYMFIFGGFLFLVSVSRHGLPASFEKLKVADNSALPVLPIDWREMRFMREISQQLKGCAPIVL